MNQVIIDNSLLAISIIAAISISKNLKGRRAGMMLSTLVLFPHLIVFLNMWAHTVAITVMNIRRAQEGVFQYNFTVYSHFLFGICFIVLSGISIHCVRKYITGQLHQRKNIFLLNLIASLLFLPVGFINPLGFLPVLTSIFSSLVLLFDRSYRKRLQRNNPGTKIILYAQQADVEV